MTDFLHFNSTIKHIGRLAAFSQEQIKAEKMLFSASVGLAEYCSGPITRAFLSCLRQAEGAEWDAAIIDSRVHMLMVGWYPCIPGWHLDDVPRTRADGQPDHKEPKYRARHAMAVVGDCSLTEFFIGETRLPDVPIGKGIVYGEWNKAINQHIGFAPYRVRQVSDGDVLLFDWQSFHRGVPATKNGWRFFIRATINTDREFFNEVRQQVQVYLPAPEAGW